MSLRFSEIGEGGVRTSPTGSSIEKPCDFLDSIIHRMVALRWKSCVHNIVASPLTALNACAHASWLPVYSASLHTWGEDKSLPGRGGGAVPSAPLFAFPLPSSCLLLPTSSPRPLHPFASISMSTISLTPDVCARFGVATDYLVLVSRPTLRVTEIEELVECEIGGFIARWRVTLEDGTNAVSQVVFPDGSDIHSSIVVGTVIKIDQMVRVPNGGERCAFARTYAYRCGAHTSSASSWRTPSPPMSC